MSRVSGLECRLKRLKQSVRASTAQGHEYALSGMSVVSFIVREFS